MNTKELETMANTANNTLIGTRQELFLTAEKTIAVKESYEAAKAVLLNSGKVDAKNAEGRQAQIDIALLVQSTALSNAEKEERKARFAFDVAQMECDNFKHLLRIAELTKAGSND